MLSRCKLAANETMKKDISFDTEMENGYKEKYKKRTFLAKKQNRSMALQTLNKTELKANRSQKTMKNLIY